MGATNPHADRIDRKRGNGPNRFLPKAQGLYHPGHERDACGMGFVVDIKGVPTHDIVTQALTVLTNLSHRGGAGSEKNTGDGAGILLQVPDQLFRSYWQARGVDLPPAGAYGVGVYFLDQATEQRRRGQQLADQLALAEGFAVLGWRDVPTNNAALGSSAISGEPFICQQFVHLNDPEAVDAMKLERRLFILRKRIEAASQEQRLYLPSFSARTVVYKGMLLGEQLGSYYRDLQEPTCISAIALVHSRFSTNTFPSWERAHPYRYVIHNGEINTLNGNENWLRAREALLKSDLLGEDLAKVLPIIDRHGSDTGKFDNLLEFLTLTGRSLPHAIMMMIPEPWSKHEQMSPEKRAFYSYHSSLIEPWDGPASIGFTDGVQVGAVLDRNGLRPSRYYVTHDDRVIMASEVGVLKIAPENIAYKGRLQPGRMLLIDTAEGRLIADKELKERFATAEPYAEWLATCQIPLTELPLPFHWAEKEATQSGELKSIRQLQHAFGYTYEDIRMILAPMAEQGKEPLGSMGDDTPPAVLSNHSQPLYNYFKQLFAQVTNPPIDAIREELVTGTETLLGSEGNLLAPSPEHCRRIVLEHPILTDKDLVRIRHIDRPGFKAATIPITFDVSGSGTALAAAMAALFVVVDSQIKGGANLLILSDRSINKQRGPIPALLATAGLHHHLIRTGQRSRVSIIVESGEPREVHHFATLLGYGADAINPFLAFASIAELLDQRLVQSVNYLQAVKHYTKGIVTGVVKILSKMGISTIQSYRGAQIFEALGLDASVVDTYFAGTPSRIGGVGLDVIAAEVAHHHKHAFPDRPVNGHTLAAGGRLQYREDGEFHLYNPATVHSLQHACRSGDYEAYRKYAAAVNDQTRSACTLRGLMELHYADEPIPLEDVESIASIIRRFKTGAMSYGSISAEAHEALAIAMNRIGGKSNTGEGGEDPSRFAASVNGDSRNSAIKQIASGRFGVTSDYLVNARELQIKMAQGAKPGEGGQLPGHKVYPWIARVRHSTPGVGLISPPPHHDIYSIEDLAQLIFDLKNANKDARINVKLVSEVGVGTIAAGVAKGHADVILISGNDGGTGASPQTSIKHAGLPWELGVAETHQTLLLNDLRSRVVIETDGQLKTGRDVVIAALLGAEEFGFATSPLIALGCIMMRVCHLNTCPVGVATQNPELRKNFVGDPEHVVNFMTFLARDVREIMAQLGFRTVDEMIGRTDRLSQQKAIDHWKMQGIDLSALLHQPAVAAHIGRYKQIEQDHGLEETLDHQCLLELCAPALESGDSVVATLPICNTNRTVATMLGSEVTRRYGAAGLPEDTIQLTFVGSAGQSFGAFVPPGLSLKIAGDSNDYLGKGLSGGKIIVHPPAGSTFKAEENVIIGNVAFYGATGGEAYISGIAGERFCVRNSGVTAVVEGVGDHGCEYMTGGEAVILGLTGRNFAAGMSGGIAYVYDVDAQFASRCNQEMVTLQALQDREEIQHLRALIWRHADYTGSQLAWQILGDWDTVWRHFVKVVPRDYEAMMTAINQAAAHGLEGDEALLAAFEFRTQNQPLPQKQLAKR